MCRYRERGKGKGQGSGEIYYEELAHRIMGAEKSHNLLSASWRPRKASGIIKSESGGLGTRGTDDVNPSLRAGEDERDVPVQSMSQKKRGEFLSLHRLFCSGSSQTE